MDFIENDIQQGKKLFNETWDYLDKTERTEEDIREMLHKTHGSLMRWRSAEKPLNNERGEWQVSHVYAVLGYGDLALLFAKECLRICLEAGIGDFDLAFAYEAMARSYAAMGDVEQTELYKNKAVEACEGIANPKEKEYCLGEIHSIKAQ